MAERVLDVQRREGAAILVLDRPRQSNALSRSLLLALEQAGKELAADPSLRAVIVTGAGDRAFSAGADLRERAGMTDAEVREQLKLYRRAFGWLGELDVPSIAALNGAAIGGGFEVALTCDLRVAAEHAVLALPETSLAIIPAAGGTQRLPRLVGAARAAEMILLGRRLDAVTALAWGAVDHVVPGGTALLDAVVEYLEPVLRGAPIAQRIALKALRAARSLPLDAGLDFERELYEQCLASADRREALAAFAERRQPRFSGH